VFSRQYDVADEYQGMDKDPNADRSSKIKRVSKRHVGMHILSIINIIAMNIH